MYCLILSSKTNLKNAYASHMYCHAQAPHVRLTATASQCPSPAYSPTQPSISQGGQPKVIQFIYLLRHEMLMYLCNCSLLGTICTQLGMQKRFGISRSGLLQFSQSSELQEHKRLLLQRERDLTKLADMPKNQLPHSLCVSLCLCLLI